MSTLKQLVVRKLRRFHRDERGNVAMMFGVIFTFVLLPLGGAAIDMSRALASRSNFQDALDATALMLGKLPAGTSTATLQQKAQQWMAANLTNEKNLNTYSIAVVPTYATSSSNVSTIQLTGTSSVSTVFGKFFGLTSLPVNVRATSTWGITKVELALVLDNTGSMASNNKMQTLISSANTLVDTLFANMTDPTRLKISVVPFSQTVNVGSSYQSAAWMTGVLPTAYQTALNAAYSGLTWPNGADIFTVANTNRFTQFTRMGTTWGGCVESRPAPYDVQDTAPSSSNPATLFVPYFAPDEPDFGVYQGNKYDTYPNNYIADASADSGMSVAWTQKQGNPAKYVSATPKSGTNSSTGYTYGPNAGCSLQPLLRLTNNKTTIHSEINGMTPVGDTNLDIGMAWGWHTISPNAPFGDGAAYGTAGVQKIVVFLTDGQNQSTPTAVCTSCNPDYEYSNNQSYYSGLGYVWQNRTGVGANSTDDQRGAALDSRTALICSNMNAANITIYTVRIDMPGTVSPAVLQNCATTSDKFYDVPNVSNLPAAFAQIAASIGSLRLSH